MLDSGEELTVKRHPDWGGGLDLLGKTLGPLFCLQAIGMPARDQVQSCASGLVPGAPSAGLLRIHGPDVRGDLGPFFSFNRCSASLWHLAVTMGSVCCTVYFDDFPCAEPSASSGSAQDFYGGPPVHVLGLECGFAAEEESPFCSNLHAPGHRTFFDGSGHRAYSKSVIKPDRVLELRAELDRILTQGFLRRSEASSLHGRLNFAQGQLHGCPIKPALKFLSQVAANGWDDSYSDDLKLVVGYIAACFATDAPRVIHALDSRYAIKLFTDGAWEQQSCGRRICTSTVSRRGPQDLRK